MNLPDPEESIKYAEAWQKFCDTYGDIIYNVLLSGQTAVFRKASDRFLYGQILTKGNEILANYFKSEEDFLKELRENPLL